MAAKATVAGEKVVAENRRARFDYRLSDRYEAGVALLGSEVKAVRAGDVGLVDSFVQEEKGELFVHKLRIGPYKHANVQGHEPLRLRKLLLNRAEIDKLISRVSERGYSIVPVRLYFKDGRLKLEIALARGKTYEDRRDDIVARESQREIDRAVRARLAPVARGGRRGGSEWD